MVTCLYLENIDVTRRSPVTVILTTPLLPKLLFIFKSLQSRYFLKFYLGDDVYIFEVGAIFHPPVLSEILSRRWRIYLCSLCPLPPPPPFHTQPSQWEVHSPRIILVLPTRRVPAVGIPCTHPPKRVGKAGIYSNWLLNICFIFSTQYWSGEYLQ